MCGWEAWRSQPAASKTPDPTGPAKWVGTVARSRALAGGRGRAETSFQGAPVRQDQADPRPPGALPALTASPSAHQGSGGETEAQRGGGTHSRSPMGSVLWVGTGAQAIGIPTCLAPTRPSSTPAPPPRQTITPLLPLTQQSQAPPGAPPQSKRSPRVERSGMMEPRATPTSSLLLSSGHGQQPAGTH